MGITFRIRSLREMPNQYALEQAAYHVTLETLTDFKEKGYLNWTPQVLENAIRGNNSTLVRELIRVMPGPDLALLIRATSNDNAVFIQELIAQQGLEPTKELLNEVARSNNLPLVQYLVEAHHLRPDLKTFDSAVKGRHTVSVVRYFLETEACELQVAADTLKEAPRSY